MTSGDELHMQRAIALAATVRRRTSPNPWVGAVIEPGGFEGATAPPGGPHAEVEALRSAGAAARGATLFSTLEPCAHHGRTPPCVDAIVDAGIARVVVGIEDPDERVRGAGVRALRAAGVTVDVGVCAGEVRDQLAPYLKHRSTGRPYVVLKLAATLDGRTAAPDGSSQWITGSAARMKVHEQRSQSDAILVGTGTVLADDPSLTARGEYGELLRDQPLPVVVGERDIPADARLHAHPRGVVVTGTRDVARVLEDLHARAIRRVYVEGGPTLASAIIAAGFADEYAIFLAPALLGGPKAALVDLGIGSMDAIRRLRLASVEQLGDDLYIHALPAKEG